MLKNGKKGHTDTLVKEHKKGDFVCPVCKKLLHESNLVDMKSIVEDNLYYFGDVRIVSNVRLECDFEHRVDDEGFTLENPHKLVAVVNAEFDETGNCVQFDIVEVLAG